MHALQQAGVLRRADQSVLTFSFYPYPSTATNRYASGYIKTGIKKFYIGLITNTLQSKNSQKISKHHYMESLGIEYGKETVI